MKVIHITAENLKNHSLLNIFPLLFNFSIDFDSYVVLSRLYINEHVHIYLFLNII